MSDTHGMLGKIATVYARIDPWSTSTISGFICHWVSILLVI